MAEVCKIQAKEEDMIWKAEITVLILFPQKSSLLTHLVR